jgi:hypothetical protein
MHTIFWLESTKGRDHSEHLGVDGKICMNFSGALSLGVKRSGREADHSSPSGAEV